MFTSNKTFWVGVAAGAGVSLLVSLVLRSLRTQRQTLQAMDRLVQSIQDLHSSMQSMSVSLAKIGDANIRHETHSTRSVTVVNSEGAVQRQEVLEHDDEEDIFMETEQHTDQDMYKVCVGRGCCVGTVEVSFVGEM